MPIIHVQFDAFYNAKELWDFLSTYFQFIGLSHYYQLHNTLVSLNRMLVQNLSMNISLFFNLFGLSLIRLKLVKIIFISLRFLCDFVQNINQLMLTCYIVILNTFWIQRFMKLYLRKTTWHSLLPTKEMFSQHTHPYNTS